jgi:polar amino acid transport system substrate-binding protein
MAARTALAASILAALLAATPAVARDWKRLRIATDGAYPPFSRLEADGRPVGFDPEVAAELCRRLQAACEITAVGWDALVPSLTAGRVDALVASIPITEAARRSVDFTAPYHRIAPRWVGRLRDTPKDPGTAALDGVAIGVRAGTAHAAQVRAAHPGARIEDFTSEAAAGQALLDHRVDLVFGDTLALYRWLDGDLPRGAVGFVGAPVDDRQYFGEGAGIAVRREDRDLGRLLDRALADMSRDGTLDRLAGHWFPFAIR